MYAFSVCVQVCVCLNFHVSDRVPLVPYGEQINGGSELIERALCVLGEGSSLADWQSRAVMLRVMCNGVDEPTQHRLMTLIHALHTLFTCPSPVWQQYFVLRDEISSHCAFSLSYMRSQPLGKLFAK